jgi:hypothetical protein
MQFTVEYEDGAWLFTVTDGGDDLEYMEEFEITNYADAKAAAADLIKEIAEAAEADDDDDDEDDAFEDFLDELDE